MDVLFEHSLPFFRASSNVNTFPSEGETSVSPNYVGAVVFWAYIGAALYFLWDIWRTLTALRKFATYRGYAYSRGGVRLLGACALVSFASLSYHMLRVLIDSYAGWTLLLPITTTGTSGSGHHGRSSSLVPSVSDLWEWSVSNSLFADFARQITADGARWTWAQADLCGTVVTAYWMGLEGRLGNGGGSGSNHGNDAGIVPVPKLWTFFALLQILPTSLTLSLFMIALLLLPPRPTVGEAKKEKEKEKEKEMKKRDGKAAKAEKKKEIIFVLLGKPGAWITTGLLYCFILVDVTQPERRAWLIPMVLLARMLLWAPLVLPFARVRAVTRVSSDDEGSGGEESDAKGRSKTQPKSGVKTKNTEGKNDPQMGQKALPDAAELLDKASPAQLIDMPTALLALSGCQVVHQSYWAYQDFGAEAIVRAINQHPAVSALGYDFAITFVVFAVWQIYGRNLRANHSE